MRPVRTKSNCSGLWRRGPRFISMSGFYETPSTSVRSGDSLTRFAGHGWHSRRAMNCDCMDIRFERLRLGGTTSTFSLESTRASHSWPVPRFSTAEAASGCCGGSVRDRRMLLNSVLGPSVGCTTLRTRSVGGCCGLPISSSASAPQLCGSTRHWAFRPLV